MSNEMYFNVFMSYQSNLAISFVSEYIFLNEIPSLYQSLLPKTIIERSSQQDHWAIYIYKIFTFIITFSLTSLNYSIWRETLTLRMWSLKEKSFNQAKSLYISYNTSWAFCYDNISSKSLISIGKYWTLKQVLVTLYSSQNIFYLKKIFL